MSTCIREGVRYKRHRWVQDEKTKGLVCAGCGLFPSTVDISQDDSKAGETVCQHMRSPFECAICYPPRNPFTLDGRSADETDGSSTR